MAKLHDADIIHDDLTTSNIMVRCMNHQENEKLGVISDAPLSLNSEELVLIDFGLSYVSRSIEDKAVDLYLLERNFLATHPHLESDFTFIINSYLGNSSKADLIIRKLSDGTDFTFVQFYRSSCYFSSVSRKEKINVGLVTGSYSSV